MSLLEQYEQHHATLIAETTAQIGRLQLHTGVEHRELCSKIDTGLAEAHELLEQIGLEIRDIDATQRPSFTSKLNCAQAELKRLQTEYRNAKESRLHTTMELGTDTDYYDDISISNDQRQHLLDNSERIERTGNRLTEGYRVAMETEAISAQVLNDLNHQRETLQSARSRLRETNAGLGRASRVLNTMMLRAMREKVILYTVGVCFILVIGFSLYLTFSSPSSPSSAA